MAIDRQTLPKIDDDIRRSWQPRRLDRSAGGIAYDLITVAPDDLSATQSVRIALIATHKGSRWQLPKGTIEEGEESLQTALREVHEETGLETELEHFLQTVEYWYWDTFRKSVPHLVQKQVDFYLLRVVSGQLSDDSYEVDGVGWFSPADAIVQLTFDDERAVLERSVATLDMFAEK